MPTEGRFSAVSDRQGEVYRKRYFRQPVFEALKLIEDAIAPHGLTMIETGLRWVVHHSQLKMRSKGGNDGIIVGVSSFEQLQGNLKDLEKGPLPEEVVQALDEAWKLVKADSTPYWHYENKYNYDTVEALFGPGAK